MPKHNANIAVWSKLMPKPTALSVRAHNTHLTRSCRMFERGRGSGREREWEWEREGEGDGERESDTQRAKSVSHHHT
jgi:hypothetical protein